MKKAVRKWLTAVFALLLLGYSAYVLLDTFVIVRVYQGIPDSDNEREAEQQAEAAFSEPQVTVRQMRFFESDVYVADIVLSDPSQLRAALAENAYGRNVTQRTSAMAKDNGALLAINGDYYGSRNSGYVIRNGVLYRARGAGGTQQDLAILADGSFLLFKEADFTAEGILEKGAMQVFSFGPGLVSDGEIIVDENSEVGKAMVSNPRTAIAMIEPLHYLFVVSDGRTDASKGLSLYQLADVLQSLGAREAYNLDGGGSSTMVYQGKIINTPTTNGRRVSEREVSDIVFISK